MRLKTPDCLIYLLQTDVFKSELQQLRQENFSTQSSRLPLNSMIQNHLLRVGGRLAHSLSCGRY